MVAIVELGAATRVTIPPAVFLMGGTGVQHGPEAAAVVERRTIRRKLWLGVAALLALAALVVVGQRGRIAAWLEPGFQVAEIGAAEKTMSLQRANHTYLVGCAEICGNFRIGKTYQMKIVGGELRYHSSGQEISLPIIEEQVGFTTTGGRG
jgi:hypothetical protein